MSFHVDKKHREVLGGCKVKRHVHLHEKLYKSKPHVNFIFEWCAFNLDLLLSIDESNHLYK